MSRKFAVEIEYLRPRRDNVIEEDRTIAGQFAAIVDVQHAGP